MKNTLISILVITVLFGFQVSNIEAKSKISVYGPTAICRDGTYSYSANHRGTCSHHKGVRVWYK